MNHRTAKAARWLATLLLACGAAARADESCDKNHFILDEPLCPALPVSDMKVPRTGHTATLLRDGRVLVAGGNFERELQGSGEFHAIPPGSRGAEIFDTATGRWSFTAAMNRGRRGHAAVLLDDGRVFVVGGESSYAYRFLPGGTAEIYDPAADTWSPTSPMSMYQARFALAATRLADGRVLVTGGGDLDGWSFGAEIYDPSTDSWSLTPGLAEARFGHTASALDDGRVLVVGGVDNNSGAALGPEMLDPLSRSSEPPAAMFSKRVGHEASPLSGGRLLVSGGSASPQTDIYDPASARWSAGSELATNRAYHAAIPLADGSVVLLGGADLTEEQPVPLASVELWREGAASRALAPLTQPRWSHTATLLPDGSILVAGGNGPGTAWGLASVERIVPR